MQDKITVKELLDNWVIPNKHYDFWFAEKKVVSALFIVDKFYVSLEHNHDWYYANGQVIEIRPKSPQSSDLDETLPIDPRKTAQQDHDEIQRLRAENEKLRDFVARIVDDEEDFYAAGIAYYAKDAKELLKGLSS